MSQPAKHDPAPAETPIDALPDPYPPYRPLYGWLFTSWLVMFLGVICIALVAYLMSYIPR